VQEAERAGRDGHQAETILYPRKINKKVTDAVKEYENNVEQCHIKKLFHDFLFSSEHNSQLMKACEGCVYVINVKLKFTVSLQQDKITHNYIEKNDMEFTQNFFQSIVLVQ